MMPVVRVSSMCVAPLTTYEPIDDFYEIWYEHDGNYIPPYLCIWTFFIMNNTNNRPCELVRLQQY